MIEETRTAADLQRDLRLLEVTNSYLVGSIAQEIATKGDRTSPQYTVDGFREFVDVVWELLDEIDRYEELLDPKGEEEFDEVRGAAYRVGARLRPRGDQP